MIQNRYFRMMEIKLDYEYSHDQEIFTRADYFRKRMNKIAELTEQSKRLKRALFRMVMAKWGLILLGTLIYGKKMNMAIHDARCAYCEHFQPEACTRCPISIQTRKSQCKDTPYWANRDHQTFRSVWKEIVFLYKNYRRWMAGHYNYRKILQ